MTVFAYSGRDQNGDAIKGALDAANAQAAAHQLLAGGIHPISIKAKKNRG